jgi:hypothetical protein
MRDVVGAAGTWVSSTATSACFLRITPRKSWTRLKRANCRSARAACPHTLRRLLSRSVSRPRRALGARDAVPHACALSPRRAGGASALHPQLRAPAQQLAAAIVNASEYVQSSRVTAAAAAAPVIAPSAPEMTTYTIKVRWRLRRHDRV